MSVGGHEDECLRCCPFTALAFDNRRTDIRSVRNHAHGDISKSCESQLLQPRRVSDSMIRPVQTRRNREKARGKKSCFFPLCFFLYGSIYSTKKVATVSNRQAKNRESPERNLLCLGHALAVSHGLLVVAWLQLYADCASAEFKRHISLRSDS